MSILFCKVKHWASLWFRVATDEIFSPISDAAALLQTLPILFTLYLVFLASGPEAMKSELLNIWAAQQTLFAIVPVFIVICMIRAGFLTVKKIRKLGYWRGDTFIYNIPQQIFTTTVSFEDNEITHFFEIKDVLVNSLVSVGFDIDRRDERVKAQITDFGRQIIDWRGATPIIRSGFRLPKNKKLGLLTLADSEADPTTIRVYAYSWKFCQI